MAVLSAACHSNSVPEPVYFAHFHADFAVATPHARISLSIAQTSKIVRVIDLAAEKSSYRLVDYEGEVERTDDRIIWSLPEEGGTIIFDHVIDSPKGHLFDARRVADGAMLRLDSLFPRARVRSLRGAKSNSSLSLSGPEGWSFESGYGRILGSHPVPDAERNFNRPVGWLVAGKLATRRETIGEHTIVVSSLSGSGARHLDLLTFLRWTFPQVADLLPSFPTQILVARAGQDLGMWRGALSAPNSLYLHEDRPLVSGNGTSTVLHELMHVGGLHSAERGSDWIVEGLSEFYSLELLRRSGGMSDERFAASLAKLQAWVAKDSGVLSSPSKGANTAAAALVFDELHQELTAVGASLDSIVQALVVGDERISVSRLEELVQERLGRSSPVLEKHGV